jgi:hypothetical protein
LKNAVDKVAFTAELILKNAADKVAFTAELAGEKMQWSNCLSVINPIQPYNKVNCSTVH